MESGSNDEAPLTPLGGLLATRASEGGGAAGAEHGGGDGAGGGGGGSSPARAPPSAAKARWGKATAVAKTTRALGAAAPDGLALGTRIWVEDTEHPRAGQFGDVRELTNKTTVRVHFDDQWDGDKGEVVRRAAIMPAAWRKKKSRNALIAEGTPRTPRDRAKSGGRRGSGASSISSRRSSTESTSRVAQLERDIAALRAQLETLDAGKEASAKAKRFREAKQAKAQIDAAEAELQQKTQELDRLTGARTSADTAAAAAAADAAQAQEAAAAALIRARYRTFDRRRKQATLDGLLDQQQQAEQARASLEMKLRVAEETLEDGVQKSMTESEEMAAKLQAEDEARRAAETRIQELQSALETASAAAAASKIQAQFRGRRAGLSARSVLRSTSMRIHELQAQCTETGHLKNELAAASAAQTAVEQQHSEVTERLSSVEDQLRETEVREQAAREAMGVAAAAAAEAVEKRLGEQNKTALDMALETAQSGMRVSVDAQKSKNAALEGEIARLEEKLETAAMAHQKQVQELSEQLAVERANSKVHEQAALRATEMADELTQAKAAVEIELRDTIAEKHRIDASSNAQRESHESIQASQASLAEQLAAALDKKAVLEAQLATATNEQSSAQAVADERVAATEIERRGLAAALKDMTVAKETVEADLASALDELRAHIGAISQLHGTVSAEQELAATTEAATQQRVRDAEEKVVMAQSASEAASKLSQAHEQSRQAAETRAESLQTQLNLVQSELNAEKAQQDDLRSQVETEKSRLDDLAAEHLAEIEVVKARQETFAEAKLDEFHEVLQRDLVALTKLHDTEKARREAAESATAAEAKAKTASEEQLAKATLEASDSIAKRDQQIQAMEEQHEAERLELASKLDVAKQQEMETAELRRQLEAVTEQKQQIEEQYATLSGTVETISETFQAQSLAAQSLHQGEVEALKGTLEGASLKAEDELRQVQSSTAEEMQRKLAELETEHAVAREQLSQQHTAAAKIQSQHHRRTARRDLRRVMDVQQHGGVGGVGVESAEGPTIEELESQLEDMQTQHDEAVATMETRHSKELDDLAGTLVADAALVAAEEHHAAVDEHDETLAKARVAHEEQLAKTKQQHEAERLELASKLDVAKQQEMETAELRRQLEAVTEQKQQIEEQYATLSGTVETISETFQAQSLAAQSLHQGEVEALKGTLEGASLKAEDELRQVQSSTAEEMQRKLAELETEHAVAREQLSQQHTAAAKIQSQHHRRTARRDLRRVMDVQQHGGVGGVGVESAEGPTIEELESQLEDMQTQHDDVLASEESLYMEQMQAMASTLAADSASDGALGPAAAIEELQLQMRSLQEAHEASSEALNLDLEASKARELRSAMEVQRLKDELVVEKAQAEERQHTLGTTMQTMSLAFKAQVETAQSLQQAVQTSMSEAAQAAIDKAASEKSTALGALETEVQALQSVHAEQMADLLAAEAGWEMAVEASAVATSQQISELESQKQELMDQLMSTGAANTASIEALYSELSAAQAKHTEAVTTAEEGYLLEMETIASTHASAVAEATSRAAAAEDAHGSLASTASQIETVLRSEIAEMREKEVELASSVITSTAAYEAVLESEAGQARTLQAAQSKMELLEASHLEAKQHAESANALLSKQHMAAAKIQAAHHRRTVRADMRALVGAQQVKMEDVTPSLDDLEAQLAEMETEHANAVAVAESGYKAEMHELTESQSTAVGELHRTALEAEGLGASAKIQELHAEHETSLAQLSAEHTAAAVIQVGYRQRRAQQDLRTAVTAGRARIEETEAYVAELSGRAQTKLVEEHVAAATIQSAHRRRGAQDDMRKLLAQGVRSAAAAEAAAERVGVLNTELHAARALHSESSQAMQSDLETVLLDMTAQHEAQRSEAIEDAQQELAWLSSKLADAEAAVVTAEQQRDAAFLYNQHSSAATMIQGFARRRQQKTATRTLLQQSSQRSTEVDTTTAALNEAVMSSSDRLEGAVRKTQKLLADALAREEQTAQLLAKERAQNAALQEQAAVETAEMAAAHTETRSELLAAHTAKKAELDTHHHAAATIQRGLRQRTAQQDLRAVVRVSQARLAQRQAEVLQGKAVLEETQDELAELNAMNESALDQLASEIQSGRNHAAAAKIQVCQLPK